MWESTLVRAAAPSALAAPPCAHVECSAFLRLPLLAALVKEAFERAFSDRAQGAPTGAHRPCLCASPPRPLSVALPPSPTPAPPPPPPHPTLPDRIMRFNYSDLEVVHRVFGSACYITSSFPR